MVSDPQLSTGWFCVATEGSTVDGRTIEAQWIRDMGETYDPATYTALIWDEHEREGGNLGEVLAAACEVEDGKCRLYVRIRPSAQLVDHNERNQKLFCSVEIEEDFLGSGRFYLGGLAVTDSPASTGTDRLRFSANRRWFTTRSRRQLISRPEPVRFRLEKAGWFSAMSQG